MLWKNWPQYFYIMQHTCKNFLRKAFIEVYGGSGLWSGRYSRNTKTGLRWIEKDIGILPCLCSVGCSNDTRNREWLALVVPLRNKRYYCCFQEDVRYGPSYLNEWIKHIMEHVLQFIICTLKMIRYFNSPALMNMFYLLNNGEINKYVR